MLPLVPLVPFIPDEPLVPFIPDVPDEPLVPDVPDVPLIPITISPYIFNIQFGVGGGLALSITKVVPDNMV